MNNTLNDITTNIEQGILYEIGVFLKPDIPFASILTSKMINISFNVKYKNLLLKELYTHKDEYDIPKNVWLSNIASYINNIYFRKWYNTYKTLTIEYDALLPLRIITDENITDKLKTIKDIQTGTYSDVLNNTNTENNTDNRSIDENITDIKTIIEDKTTSENKNSIYGFNSLESVPSDESNSNYVNTGNENNTVTKSSTEENKYDGKTIDNSNSSGTRSNTREYERDIDNTRYTERKGNIGNYLNSDIILKELEKLKIIWYDIVLSDIYRELFTSRFKCD